MSNKKKLVVMSALVLLLAVTAVFNFVLSGASGTVSTDNLASANYFATYRSERTSSRSEELIQLDSVIALYEPGDDRFEEATQRKIDIVSAMEKELVIENMVKSLGFSDAVISVSATSENVNVFINTPELNYDSALSIYTMLKNETGTPASNIRIVPVYSES